MANRHTSRVSRISAGIAVVMAVVLSLTAVGAATNWKPLLVALSKGEAQARPAITTATTNPVTFSAACNGTLESAVLTWTTAGKAVTGYEVLVSSTINGTFALDTTQPVGTALTVTETYTAATGNKFYRLEAKSASWPFPGTTITNAREASVLSTLGGFVTMASSGTLCTATA